MRVGIGWDIHRLEPGARLVLAGVDIPSESGAVSRTDGDVVLHALIDAMLGAACLGDIGGMFPETDDRFLGVPSCDLLRQATDRVLREGYSLNNVDVNVILERPKLRPHFDRMRARLSELLGMDLNRINVKARTSEGMGPIGVGDAVVAQVVLLLSEATS